MITVEKCPCGHPACNKWHLVGIGTFYQGSGFEKAEAETIADLLNGCQVQQPVMNEALLRNLTDQELVRYAGQQLPPELYSRLVTLFDEQTDLEQQLEQQEEQADEREAELTQEISELHAEIIKLEREIDTLEAEQ